MSHEPKELPFGTSILRDQKCWKLPALEKGFFLSDGILVQPVILSVGNYSIEGGAYPIRYKKYYGNRIFINTMVDPENITPAFIFDAIKKEWVLTRVGYVCFAEQEIEYPKIDEEE